ncbi:MAG TPA: hypothetical protein PLX97_07010 [Gemmatales bacterium]|nr:hypothetical protein [Gemmatales bacterium]
MPPYLRTLRNTQVIAIALILGLLILVAILFFMLVQVKPGGFIGGQGPQWNNLPLLTVFLAGLGVVLLGCSLILPPVVTAMNLKRWQAEATPLAGTLAEWEQAEPAWLEKVPADTLDKLLQVFQSDRLLKLVLPEGAGILGAMAYLLEGHWLAIVVLFLAIATMVLRIPTSASLLQWLAVQMGKVSVHSGERSQQ